MYLRDYFTVHGPVPFYVMKNLFWLKLFKNVKKRMA